MASDRVEVEKFDGKDFAYWKMQIEDVLYQKKLYLPLKEMPKDYNKAEWEVLDRQALATVRLSLSRRVAFNVSKCKTTKELMTALENVYEKPSAMNKVYIMRQLFNLKMTENGSAVEHLNEFNQIICKLSSVSIEFDDDVKALLFLSSLPSSWDLVAQTISTSAGKEKLKFMDVCDLILGESVRRREVDENSGGAYTVEMRGRGRNAKDRGRGRSASRGSSSRVKCWNCGEMGHVKRDCPKPKNRGGSGEEKGNEEKASVNMIEEDYSDVL